MNIVNNKDFLEVKLASLIADYDVETIANLYQPIIGYQAASLYFALWSEAKNQKITSLITHEQLFTRMQIFPGDYVEARKALEAIGLIKTFLEKNPNTSLYHYDVYAPKTPKDFFDNSLLFGMLIKNIGEADANRFKAIYFLDQPAKKGDEISATFAEVFHPDFENPVFAKVLGITPQSVGRCGGKILLTFSYEQFFISLSEVSQIKPEALTKKEMKEIERLATLYGVNEITAANDVASTYQSQMGKGKRVDFAQLTKLFQDETNYNYLAIKRNNMRPQKVSGSTDLAHKINLLEITSPKDYLSLLQNGTRPASADLRLINDLSSNFNLSNGVINAVIDFILTVNNNVLNRAYSEKIAGSIAREGITTVIDAMNFLRRVYQPKEKSAPIPSPTTEGNTNDPKTANENKTSSASDTLSWEEMIDDLDGGGSDGKA
ncbi:MAG TPA: DnaD domain protein [Bacilli bacterium]|nr:DnaD domain protein [Bacilli bacterium]HPS19237.1 DnaD domain protein [Bacilli bacterium]